MLSSDLGTSSDIWKGLLCLLLYHSLYPCSLLFPFDKQTRHPCNSRRNSVRLQTTGHAFNVPGIFLLLNVLSVCLSVPLSVCLSRSVFPVSDFLYVCLSDCISVCFFVCLSVCLSICLCTFFHFSLAPLIRLSFCVSVSPSVSLTVLGPLV